MQNEASSPKVSIIVPASGLGADLSQLIDSLLGLAYPPERREIIVVDNGLSRDAVAGLAQLPVRIVEEHDARSAGLARNAGVRAATGEIFAFVDSDCIVDTAWLQEGVRFLQEENADMVAGRIVFRFSSRRTAAEIFDSLVHMQNESLVKLRGLAVTANLFVRRHVFDNFGGFPAYVGEDFAWTRSVVERGARLAYSERAIVTHPTRGFGPLMVKAKRVAPSAVRELREGKMSAPRLRRHVLAALLPSPAHVGRARRLIAERGAPWMTRKTLAVAAVAYLYGVQWGTAVIRELLRKTNSPR